MRAKPVQKILAILATLGLLLSIAPAVQAANDSKGVDFWLTFQENYDRGQGEPLTLTLFLTGGTNTNGTVAIPGLGFTKSFSITVGTVTSVVVPNGAMQTTADGVGNNGIHVTAAREVTVYGLSRRKYTTDAYLGLPTDILGTEYFAMTYSNNTLTPQLSVVATQSGTTVTITPKVTVGSRSAGTPYTINLNQGQTYQLRGGSDLTGTLITANKPIAAFSGHQCANIPVGYDACDHIVEQLTPTSAWGKDFVTMPLATRTKGDTFRFVAATNGTQISVNGGSAINLNRGQFSERVISDPARITANNPILVAQFSNGSEFDGVTSDPFMVLIPPYEQFLTNYTVTTPATGFAKNFINVVAPNAAIGAITLDGTAIPVDSYQSIPGTNYSGAKVTVTLGAHNLAGAFPFGITVYGFDSYDSYGYPGGMSLSPVALATTLTVAPKTASKSVGAYHCVTATVKDQNAVPLPGVRVDFAVTGVNPNAGPATSNASGQAQYCYTGNTQGNDTITARVGTLSDTAAITWGPFVAETLVVQTDGTGTVAVSPTPTTSAGTPNNMTYTFAKGALVTLTTTLGTGQVFTRWAIDGVGDLPYGKGWASPMTIVLDTSHTTKAFFTPRPVFNDLAPGNAAYIPATELAARGIVKGFTAEGCAGLKPPVAAPCYGANNPTARVEVAAFLARLLGIAEENHGAPPFSDVGALSPELQRAVANMAHYGLVKGYQNGSFGPYDKITHTDLILMISRSMGFKGYWVRETVDNPEIYTNLTFGGDARLDIITYILNADDLPGFANTTPRAPLDQPAPRTWAAQALWQALNSYFGVDAPGKGGYIP